MPPSETAGEPGLSERRSENVYMPSRCKLAIVHWSSLSPINMEYIELTDL